MITFALSDLVTPVTVDQFKKSIYDALGVLGVSTTTWKPGGVVRTIITVVSVMLAALSALVAKIAASGFMPLAEGSWLTLVAYYVYNVSRYPASFAYGDITFVNSGGGVFSILAGGLTVSSSTTGKAYRNLLPISIGSFATVTASFEAIEAGSGSTAFPGEIDTMITTLSGVTCTNAAAFAGQEAEEDAALKRRCSDKLGSLSPNGPADAYAHFARAALRSDGSNVGITRIRTRPDEFGNVYIYVANAAGGVTGTVGDLATDLGLVDEAIQLNATPLGINPIVSSAVAVPTPITYTLWCLNTSGLTDAQAKTAVSVALSDYLSRVAIGGNSSDVPSVGAVYASELTAVIASAVPGTYRVDLATADIPLSEYEVATLGLVTATVNQRAPVSL